jgi:hypothetical protein
VLNDAYDEVLGGFGDWADATAALRCDLLSARYHALQYDVHSLVWVPEYNGL